MTIKTTVALSVVAITLGGCGTLNTVLRDDLAATRELRRQRTYCQSVSRIYSGLAFDFCLLHAPPDYTGMLVPLILLDITASGIADTVVLPYTSYRQYREGSIEIYR